MHFCSKLIKEMQNILKTNPKIFTTDYCEFNATYVSRFQIVTILEIKCNSGVFLLKIDQGNARNLQNKPKNITTDNGELTLHMVPGSKSGEFYRKMQFRCISAQNWSRNCKKLENKPKNNTTNYGELRLHMLPGSKSRQF